MQYTTTRDVPASLPAMQARQFKQSSITCLTVTDSSRVQSSLGSLIPYKELWEPSGLSLKLHAGKLLVSEVPKASCM